jgi:hypothetical protein
MRGFDRAFSMMAFIPESSPCSGVAAVCFPLKRNVIGFGSCLSAATVCGVYPAGFCEADA